MAVPQNPQTCSVSMTTEPARKKLPIEADWTTAVQRWVDLQDHGVATPERSQRDRARREAGRGGASSASACGKLVERLQRAASRASLGARTRSRLAGDGEGLRRTARCSRTQGRGAIEAPRGRASQPPRRPPCRRASSGAGRRRIPIPGESRPRGPSSRRWWECEWRSIADRHADPSASWMRLSRASEYGRAGQRAETPQRRCPAGDRRPLRRRHPQPVRRSRPGNARLAACGGPESWSIA